MATLVLSAAGSALGGALGGSFAGLTTMALGKAVGATLGAAIDQRLMGVGSEPVETGRVERFRVMGSSEGAALPRAFGRVRLGGQIIWSSRFLETVRSERVGGKGGGGGGTTVREFSYSVSLAIALCEGVVSRVGRIWADGQPLDQSGLTWRLHAGTESQLPDPLIAALEGNGDAPAYRGTAYVVFENLDLTPFGNRIPQFNFEVFRRPAAAAGVPRPPALDIRGVALVPGTGEYALATEPVYFRRGRGDSVALNVHNDQGAPDLVASLDQLDAELPNADSVSLVVSWFGDDLRCDRCRLRPAVEQAGDDGDPIRWKVSGQSRADAHVVSRLDGRPIFGGTPADATVVQAIRHLKATGRSVMFYPFILMDIQAGNGLTDPWSGEADQPRVPWRGRITLKRAPGRPGSADKSPEATAEVRAFFGDAEGSDFDADDDTVEYSGPSEWSYRRFILHYAHLCEEAGGVDAFCIGSEMRGLTHIRDGADSYPAVRALCDLAADVRGILGPGTKVGYAADWSEYFGHRPAYGSGDMIYHLDPLWAHPAVDFVGIDNYMPLSDWRDGSSHADAGHGSIYDLDYLKGNVAGGEGYDWWYADAAGRDAQARLPITDGAYDEPWVFRYKDLVNWWSRPHVDRLAGVKVGGATAWQPRSKPIWFTELGCPAVNKGTNQPNVFHDPKSSESFVPHHSNGSRDDLIQYRYLQSTLAHWSDPANNPASDVYAGRMVDMSRAHVWAWDARPWPDFPSRIETWIDGDNYHLGHWLNGRTSLAALDVVTAELCARSGLPGPDVRALHGGVTGYAIESVESARQSLQPLMLAYGFDGCTVDGRLVFSNRGGRVAAGLTRDRCVVTETEAVVSRTRAPAIEAPGRVTVGYVRSDRDYLPGAAEAFAPDAPEPSQAQSSLPIVLSDAEARTISERWLREGRTARDIVAFSLPPSGLRMTTGDVVSLESNGTVELYRIDRVEEMGHREVSAVRIEPSIYDAPVQSNAIMQRRALIAATPVHAELLDLPLLTGEEEPHAPHVAVAKSPWAGPVAVYSASDDFGYTLNRELLRPAIMGETLEGLGKARPGLWMQGSVRVRIDSGSLQSRGEVEVLNGANVGALRFGPTGDWEVIQFARADLVGAKEYRLSGLLRGQAGTDGVVPEVWPAGAQFVLLDGAVTQLGMPASARGLDRHYRIGPAIRGYDDPSYRHQVWAAHGAGLRPYRPVHAAAARRADGGIELAWVRRTRIDGDNWEGNEVPLGEDRELYHVRVRAGGAVLREFVSTAMSQVYSADEQAADGATTSLVFEIAQLSDRFGAGFYERIDFNG